MGGAAVVVGTLYALSELQVPVNAIGTYLFFIFYILG